MPSDTNGGRVEAGGPLALSHVKLHFGKNTCDCELCQYTPHIIKWKDNEVAKVMPSDDMQPDSLYQRITDVCFENGGVSKRMVDKLHKLFEQELALYAPKPDESVEKIVGECIGAASMCWEPLPSKQVFDTERAIKLTKDTAQKLAAHYQAKQDRAVREAENRFKSSIDRYELTRDYSKGNLSAPIMEYYRLKTLQKERG